MCDTEDTNNNQHESSSLTQQNSPATAIETTTVVSRSPNDQGTDEKSQKTSSPRNKQNAVVEQFQNHHQNDNSEHNNEDNNNNDDAKTENVSVDNKIAVVEDIDSTTANNNNDNESINSHHHQQQETPLETIEETSEQVVVNEEEEKEAEVVVVVVVEEASEASEEEDINTPIPFVSLQPTYYTSEKYNEQPFNKRYYTFHSHINNTNQYSVKQLHSLVFDDWDHCTERSPFVYQKQEPVEFYRPTSDHMNMVMTSNGSWVIGGDDTGNSLNTSFVISSSSNQQQQHNRNSSIANNTSPRNSLDTCSSGSANLSVSDEQQQQQQQDYMRQSMDQSQQQQQQQTPHRNMFMNVIHQIPRLSIGQGGAADATNDSSNDFSDPPSPTTFDNHGRKSMIQYGNDSYSSPNHGGGMERSSFSGGASSNPYHSYHQRDRSVSSSGVGNDNNGEIPPSRRSFFNKLIGKATNTGVRRGGETLKKRPSTNGIMSGGGTMVDDSDWSYGRDSTAGYYNGKRDSSATTTSPNKQRDADNAHARATKGSITEYLEKKAINETELSAVIPLTKSSVLDKMIEIRDETRILSVHDAQFEFIGGKERISCRRKRQGIDPYTAKKKSFVLFQFDQLKLDCGSWEPLFCKVYLYDAQRNRKLSEDYGFHINNKQELSLLDDVVREHLEQVQSANIYEKPTVLFRLSDPNPDVYIVVLVERILQGSPEDSDKVYEKDAKFKDKALKRNKESIKKLSHFRQPFLIGAFNVYSQGSDNNLNIVDGIRMVKFRRLNRLSSKEMFDIGKYLPETELNTQDMVLWASMRVEIKSVDSDSLNDLFVTYNQSKHKMESRLHSVHTQRNGRTNRFGLETSLCTFFDVADEFPYELPLFHSLEFKNTLYVYLDSADLSFASFKHTTFVIEVFMKKTDSVTATKITCIGDPFDPTRLNTSALSSVTKHERSPQFISEFRIEVPMDAYTSNCHLYFEIYAVKTNVFGSHAHQYGYAVLKSVGSSFIKLFNDENAMIRDGSHVLPIYTKIDDGYMRDDSKCTKAKGYNLNIRTRHASTIFMQDNNASLFMHCLDDLHQLLGQWNEMDRKNFKFFERMAKMMDQLNRDIPKVMNSNFAEVTRHSHVLLNSLLVVMSRLRMIVPSEEDFDNYSSDDELMFLHSFKKQSTLLVKNIFSGLLYCLHGITAVEGRRGRESKTLMSYIDTFFNMSPNTTFFSTLFDYWIEFMDNCDISQLPSYKHKYESQYPPSCDRRRKSWTRIEFEKASQSLTPRQAAKVQEEKTSELSLNALDSINFSWFFFELALKSIMLQDKTPEILAVFKTRANDLISRMCPILISCIQQRKTKGVINEVARRCNYDIALFLRDLLQFTDVNFVSDLVETYLNNMKVLETDNSEIEYAKVSHMMDFLDLYTEYEGFTNIYIDHPERAHLIIDCMIENIARGTKNAQSDLRLKSVYVFRKHLTKLDFDAKFNLENDPKRNFRKKVMYPYFKFVQLFVEDSTLLRSAPTTQTIVDALVCVYSILLFTSEKRVIEWLNTDPDKYVPSFYDMLLLTSIVIRKYDNVKTRINLTKLFPRVFVKYVQKYCLDMSSNFTLLASELSNTFRKQLDKDSTNSEEEVIHMMASSLSPDNFWTEDLIKFVKLFDKCSYFYVNIMLLRPYIDSGIFLEIVQQYVYPFLKQFNSYYLLSRVVRLKTASDSLLDKSRNEKLAKYDTGDAWQMITASILLNTALPIDLAVPIIGDCLQVLLLIYQRKEANVGEEEEAQDATPSDNGTGEQAESNHESPKKSEAAVRSSIVSEGFLNYTNENSHMIRAATFRKLVERLFQNNPGYTPPFNDCFLLTYFSVASSNQVLQEIISITHEVPYETDKAQKLLRVVNALKMWVTEHFVNMNCTFLASLISFLANDLTKIIRDELSTVTYHKPLLSSLLRKMIDVQAEKKQQAIINLEPPIVPARFYGKLSLSKIDNESFNLFEWDSMELARQITVLDARYFMQIQHTELIAKKKTFDAPELSVRMATAPNLTRLCLQFDALSSWVQSCILKQTSVDERVRYIKKLFEVCEKLYEIGNFHSCFAVRSGFRQSGVIRLAKTWQKIPQIEDTITKKYGELFKHPYTNLLAEYDMRPPPMIPLAAQFQAEVYFASLNSKYVLDKVSATGEKLVNYDRMRLLSRVIRRLKIKQQATYNFTPIPFLIDFFSHLESMDEDTAYNTSLELEPKNRT